MFLNSLMLLLLLLILIYLILVSQQYISLIKHRVHEKKGTLEDCTHCGNQAAIAPPYVARLHGANKSKNFFINEQHIEVLENFNAISLRPPVQSVYFIHVSLLKYIKSYQILVHGLGLHQLNSSKVHPCIIKLYLFPDRAKAHHSVI